MVDPVAILTVMAGQAIIAAVLACLAWTGLHSVQAGSARARHAVAAACFYGAALWPLASLLPQHLSVAYGPEAVPLFEASALVLGDTVLTGMARTLCLALIAAAALVALFRLALTARAALLGEIAAARTHLLAPQNFGLPDHVRVGASDQVSGPILIGLLQPTIRFPTRLEYAQELPTLLRHELAHLHRGDLRAALIQRVIEDLCWWNWPLQRLGSWLAEQREMACDEWAADLDGAYALALVRETRTRLAPPPLAAGISGAAIERRLERLAETQRRPLALIAALIALSVLAAAVAAPRLDRESATHIGIATT